MEERSVEEIAGSLRSELDKIKNPKLQGLDEICYTLSEGGAWEDCVDSVGMEQCLLCWKAVEYARRLAMENKELPTKFRL